MQQFDTSQEDRENGVEMGTLTLWKGSRLQEENLFGIYVGNL